MTLHNDKDYWKSLTWPAAPNLDDYRVFEHYCKGRVLLLGSTKLLLPLATEAWDVNPVYDDPKIKSRDWFTLDQHWNTVIIDGALTWGKEFTHQLLSVVLSNCDCFISRTFLNPSWPTKYAVYFPLAHELDPIPKEHPINEIYTFYIWKNTNKQY
jgi:hypothetical protein